MNSGVPVIVDWSLWDSDRPGAPPRLLASSDGPGVADDLAGLLALRPESGSDVAFTGLVHQDQDYLGVVLEVPLSAVPETRPEGDPKSVKAMGCFLVPYDQIAAGTVSYQALHAGLRALIPPIESGTAAEVLLEPINLDQAERSLPNENCLTTTAALLLTGHPVCVLGADATSVEDRLRFLDDVTALLPYGMRSRLGVSTWASGESEGLRLYFSATASSAGVHTIDWNSSILPPVEDRYAAGYLTWLQSTKGPGAILVERTAQLGFGQADIQALLAGLGIADGKQPRSLEPSNRATYAARGSPDRRAMGSAAFMSYSHSDNEYEGGRLSVFRAELSRAVQFHTGQKFPIFQDRDGVPWGTNWRQRIKEALDGATLLLPIITPSFFASDECQNEVTLFLSRERRLGQRTLILPIYYADCAQIEESRASRSHVIGAMLGSRQYADWRDLRLEEIDSNRVRVAIDELAQRVRDTLNIAEEHQPDSDQRSADLAPPITTDQLTLWPAGMPLPRSRPARSEFVVDQYGQGDFRSISAAIRAGRPGDQIRVRPGVYSESLVMDKPLEITGEGSRNRVIVQARSRDVLVFTADAGRVCGLTLRQIGGGARWNSVFIERGRLELEDCDISCQSMCGIDIGEGADPLIAANKIHDCRQAGILIHDAGCGTLRDNDIYANAYAGVEIRMNGNPTLTRNRIHHCQHAGVLVHESGEGLIEENDIYAMLAYGVTIRTRGNPKLAENSIHDCALNGVFISRQGEGTLEDNKIYATGYSGVAIRDGANPVLSGNQVHDTKEAGILVSNGGLGLIEDNDIYNNAMAGVRIRNDANPTLRRNRIFDNQGMPIDTRQGGRGTFEENELNGQIQDAATRKSAGKRRIRPWGSVI